MNTKYSDVFCIILYTNKEYFPALHWLAVTGCVSGIFH